MKKICKDQVLGIIVVIIGAFFGYQTYLLPKTTLQGDPGPKVFPAIACVLLGLCGLILLVRPDRKPQKQFLSKEEWKRLLTLYCIYILYWALLWLVGYRIAIPVILFIISFLFSRGTKVSWVKIILYTVGVSAFMYVLYIVIMQTRLPGGILFG